MSAYLAERSSGNLALRLPFKIGSMSGRVLYILMNDLNSAAAESPTAGSIASFAEKSILAISQLLGDGQAGESLLSLWSNVGLKLRKEMI